jgi:CRP-like cAMP-binding protein
LKLAGLVAAATGVGRIVRLQEIAKEIVMATKQLQSVFAAFPDGGRSESSLVRRLVRAKDDPAKQRIRAWLCDIDDERLRRFGLTAQDIALLRGSSRHKPARRLHIV